MTDRLTPADVLRIVADGIWTPRKGATTVYGEEAMRAGIAHRLRDEAARREAEAPGPRTGPNKEGAGVPRFPFPKSIDAPPPPPPPAPLNLVKGFDDPETDEAFDAALRRIADDERTKLRARAEVAEADAKRLREMLPHIIPRLEKLSALFGQEDSELQCMILPMVRRAALAQGGNDG